MNRVLTGGLLSVVLALGVATSASAVKVAPGVQRSGNVFHKNVCLSPAPMHAACDSHVVTNAKGELFSNASAPVGGYGPDQLRDAYKITGVGKKATVIAIIDAFGYTNAEADLGTYRANFGLPKCTTKNGCFKKLNQNGVQGSYPAQNIGWAQESALDVDMASAMCPKCSIWLVEGNDNSYNNLGIAVNTAATMGAHVISNSYSGGEGGTSSLEAPYNRPGLAVTASTGDHGFAAGTQFPASSAHVIAVGGTRLTADGSARGWTESAWTGAGSGCSTIYAKPAYQHDPTCTKRMEADVSAVADPSTGVAVYGPNASGVSTWLIFGGTSVSAPLVGGIYGVKGKPVTNYGESLYKKSKKLFDVTTGNNGTGCGGTYFCIAGPGYDGPTGMGTPNGTGAF